MNIIQALLEKKVIDKDRASKLEAQVQASQKKPEDVILAEKITDEEFLFNVKADALQIPLQHVDAKDIPLKTLELVPEDSAKYYRMIPLSQKGNALEIGMVSPEDQKAQEALQFLARQGNFSFKVALITPGTFEAVMKQYRNLKGGVNKALEELQEEIQVKGATQSRRESSELQRLVEEAPITKMVAVVLRNAVEGAASDIHIEPERDKVRVRFRLMGELYSSLVLPREAHQAMVTRIKILSNLKIDETRVPQDGRFSATIDEKNIDFRVATFPTAFGEKVAIRVLDPNQGLKSFEELGLEDTNLQKIKEAMQKPFGLILVTGPTGSGKTTTLYGLLRGLNGEDVNIVSLEDPVEYLIEGVNQSQVRAEIGYDFPQGLRQILRQDPDVIMVGEVRDKETAVLVIHASLTGHIVLSTLHTNNAAGVITRLLDMGIDKYLIPATLSIALSQRLVRHLCDACRERVEAKKEIADLIDKELKMAAPNVQKRASIHVGAAGSGYFVFQAKGCKKCGGSGYVGRIGIFEVLKMTEELATLVLTDPSEAGIAKEAKRQGMITMRQDGILKALDGITTIEEVLRETSE